MNIAQKLSYGVYAVTTWRDGEPKGCIANCAIQVTSEPATFAVSINHDNYTNEQVCGVRAREGQRSQNNRRARL